ncbi:ArfGap-domain-containing protein [Ramicandelaber brevisporus]|nr:ArfGap-domain-containing protein [Ramicandelaber brevisporus]
MIDLAECLLDTPAVRTQLAQYEDFAVKFEGALRNLVKLDRETAALSANIGQKSLETVALLEKAATLNENGNGQMEATFAEPMDDFVKREISPLKEAKRSFGVINDEHDSILARVMGKKVNDPQLADAERELADVKLAFFTKYTNYALQLNETVTVKRLELLEFMLASMYTQFAFFHQGYELLRDLEPEMRQLSQTLAELRSNGISQVEKARKSQFDLLRNLDLDDTDSITTNGTPVVAPAQPQRQSTSTSPETSHSPGISKHLQQQPQQQQQQQRVSLEPDYVVTSGEARGSIADGPPPPLLRSGHVFVRTDYKILSTWTRRHMTLDGSCVTITTRTGEVLVAIPLHVCMVKRATNVTDRRFCFEIVTPSITYTVQAENNRDLELWMSALSRGVERAFYRDGVNLPSLRPLNPLHQAHLDETLARHATSEDTLSTSATAMSQGSNPHNSNAAGMRQNSNVPLFLQPLAGVSLANASKSDIIRALRDIPGNKACADCGARDPQWASLTFGSLVCIECSGIHRSLGVHISKVRSLPLDHWEPEQIHLLVELGNTKVNLILQSEFSPVTNPSHQEVAITPKSTLAQRERFIVAKYKEKKFAKTVSNDNPPNQVLWQAAEQGNVELALQALVSSADPNYKNRSDDNGTRPVLQPAADIGSYAVMELLTQWQADINACDGEGRTALHNAAAVAMRVFSKLAQGVTIGLVALATAAQIAFASSEHSITATASFPDSEFHNLFRGTKNHIVINVDNKDQVPYTITKAYGQLLSREGLAPSVDFGTEVLRNLNVQLYRTRLSAMGNVDVNYKFYVDLEPGTEAQLVLHLGYTDKDGKQHSIIAHNEIINIAEYESWFDPQLWSIYLMLITGFGGAAYFAYDTYVANPSTASGKDKKKADAEAKAAVAAADAGSDGEGGASTAGAGGVKKSTLDSWLPDQHKKSSGASPSQTASGGAKKRTTKTK